MHRLVPLVVALAHLGAASVPCLDLSPEFAGPRPAPRVRSDSMGTRVALPVVDHPGHPGHAGHAAEAGHAVHAHHAVHTEHVGHAAVDASSRAAADGQHAAHVHERVEHRQPAHVATHHLKAQCGCGCSKGAAAQNPRSSRIGFALLPPRPALLREANVITAPPLRVRLTAIAAHLPDHVPIPT